VLLEISNFGAAADFVSLAQAGSRAMRLRNFLVAATMLLMAGVTPAAANSIHPGAVTVTDLGDTYEWAYGASLITGQLNNSGQAFFTIYDIMGYVPGTAAATSSDWQAVESLTGQDPTGLSPTDSPTLYNVTFVYQGSPIVAGLGPGPQFLPVVVSLGTFKFESIYGTKQAGIWGSQDLAYNNPNSVQVATFETARPLPDGGWTVAMLGSALLAIGLLRRRLGVR
jgi:hypothetical protein